MPINLAQIQNLIKTEFKKNEYFFFSQIRSRIPNFTKLWKKKN